MSNRFTRLFTQHEQSLQTRDPQAATQLLRWQGRNLPQIEEWDAEQAYRKGYILNAFTYAAINAIATDLASVPFRAHSELPDEPTEGHEFDKNANLAKLLGPPPFGPAPSISARKLWRYTIIQRLVTGRSGWEIEGTPNSISALWPLISQYLHAIPTPAGSAMWAGFEYGTGPEPKRLRTDQVFYTWSPAANDFRQAESPLQAARINIDLAVFNDKYNWSFYQNDAAPATMVTHQRMDDKDSREAWRDQFKSGFRGSQNAGGVMFNEVESDADGKVLGTVAIERLGLSQRDAEMAVQYRQSVQAILVALGVPLSRLMDASARTFSNAGEEIGAYWRSTILPLGVELSEDVNAQLAPRVGKQYGWFDFSGVAELKPAEDKTFSLSSLPDLEAAGIVTKEWAAEQVGADPKDVQEDAPVPEVLQPFVEGPAADPEPETPVERTRDRKGAEVRAVNRRVEYLEARWERSFRTLFARQAASVLSKLDSSRGRKVTAGIRADNPDINSVYDQAYWAAETETMALGLYADIADQAVLRTVETLAPETDTTNVTLRVKNILDTKALLVSGQITQTTQDSIRTALIAGVEAGEGSDLIAKRVSTVFDDAKGSRAKLIARTEVVGSFNQASLESAKLLPREVVDSKQWLATNDARTRPEHAAVDNQIQPLDSPFNVGGKMLQHPGEPGCRCTILLGLKGDLS